MMSFFIKSDAGRTEIQTLCNMEIMAPYTYEPKTDRRFLVKITNKQGVELVPSYVVRSITRPQFSYTWFGTKKYELFEMDMYDPIVPSTMHNLVHSRADVRLWNINIRILGPVGDTVEEWNIKNAKLMSVLPSEMDWRNSGEPASILVKFKISNVQLLVQ